MACTATTRSDLWHPRNLPQGQHIPIRPRRTRRAPLPRPVSRRPSRRGMSPRQPPLPLPADRLINREVSWLAFNSRVLEEARNPHHPLLERLRFLSISASNLDEFQTVRVAALKAQRRAGIHELSADNRTPEQQLALIEGATAGLNEAQQLCWRELEVELAAQSIEILRPADLGERRSRLAGGEVRRRYLSGPHPARRRSRPSLPFPRQSRRGHRPCSGRSPARGADGGADPAARPARALHPPARRRRALRAAGRGRADVPRPDLRRTLEPARPRAVPGAAGFRDGDRRERRGSAAELRNRPEAAAPWRGHQFGDRERDARRSAQPPHGRARGRAGGSLHPAGADRPGRRQAADPGRAPGPAVQAL